jgi:hypothetical protein
MPADAMDGRREGLRIRGADSLLDLFEGRRQLIVYRAFFEPGVFGWPEHACRGCSLGADQVAHLAHLNARNTTLAYTSRAPQADIARLKARMGWEMPWYTITDSFDGDFGVDEWHGHNVFFRDGDKLFRTYFINSRGDEAMGATSTSRRLAVRRLGRTRRRATPRPRRTSGGTGTTTTIARARLTRSGSRCPTLEKPPFESAIRRQMPNRPLSVHSTGAVSLLTAAAGAGFNSLPRLFRFQ